ncbi:AGAP012588-PA-like protein [Anopheles sinensis]|uniref:AGAP012588-PA-like protein n=1 Tax=Anopheles sinensis TaxID=74873 RepID=A0A084VAI0_ANOSI|nr:AGAP012588-PA-like protein [Anopheles sinensis]
MEKYSLEWLKQLYPQFTVAAVDLPAPPEQATVAASENTVLSSAAQWLERHHSEVTITAVDPPAQPLQATVAASARTVSSSGTQWLERHHSEDTITAVDPPAQPQQATVAASARTVSPAAAGLGLARLETQSRPPTPPATPPVSSVQCLGQATNTASPDLSNADIARALARMDEKLDRLSNDHGVTRVMLEMSVERLLIDRSVCSHFEFVHLETREQMREFEVKLGQDTAFADTLVDQLKGGTAHCDYKTRIARALDSLFSRQLLSECTWTGAGRTANKISFCSLKNTLVLLRRVVGTSDRQSPAEAVEVVVRSRLRNAKKRLAGNPGRNAYCIQKKGLQQLQLRPVPEHHSHTYKSRVCAGGGGSTTSRDRSRSSQTDRQPKTYETNRSPLTAAEEAPVIEAKHKRGGG